jgi:hypothetical protein
VREGSTAFPQLGFEPDSFDLRLWLRHQFSNRLEVDPKLAVVFLFQFIEPPREGLVRADHRAQGGECSHNAEIRLNRARYPAHSKAWREESHRQRLAVFVFVAPNL